MKYYFLVFRIPVIALFLLSSCSQVKSDLTKVHLKGKVKSITEYTYSATEKFGKAQKDKLTSKIISNYNDKGNLTTQSTYEMKNSSFMVDSFTYNSNSKLTESSTHILGQTDSMVKAIIGALAIKFSYIYDKEGNEIERNKYLLSDNTLQNKYICKFDKDRNKVEENSYDSDGNLDEKLTYKYDKEGNEIERNEYDSEHNLKEKFIHTYDNDNNVIERIKYNADGKLDWKSKIEYILYDSKGNWLNQINYFKDKPVIIIERTIKYY